MDEPQPADSMNCVHKQSNYTKLNIHTAIGTLFEHCIPYGWPTTGPLAMGMTKNVIHSPHG
jgi:hypothetical protein